MIYEETLLRELADLSEKRKELEGALLSCKAGRDKIIRQRIERELKALKNRMLVVSDKIKCPGRPQGG